MGSGQLALCRSSAATSRSCSSQVTSGFLPCRRSPVQVPKFRAGLGGRGWASVCCCGPRLAGESSRGRSFPASFTNRLTLPLILHRPTVPVSLCPCVPLPSQASRSRPVLSLQTGCLWSWSAWLSSSSSSSWASAGVSAAPTPAAVTSGAPAARTSAAAQRPVSAPHVPTPAGLPPGFRGRRQPGAGFPGQRHWSGGCEVSSGPRGIFCSR